MSKWYLSLAVTLAVAPAALAGIAVQFDEGTDFSGINTYVLQEGTAAQRPGARTSIARALEGALSDRGLRKVDRDPDAYVVSHVLVDIQSLEKLDDPDYWEFITGVRTVDSYDVGAATLVVDLVDPQTRTVIWRGIVTDVVEGSIDKMKKKVDRGVRKLFKQFPAQTGGGNPE